MQWSFPRSYVFINLQNFFLVSFVFLTDLWCSYYFTCQVLSSTSDCHLHISSSGFQALLNMISLLFHLNLFTYRERSFWLPLLISRLFSLSILSLWESLRHSSREASLWSMKILKTYDHLHCRVLLPRGLAKKKSLPNKDVSSSFTAYLWRLRSNAFFSVRQLFW